MKEKELKALLASCASINDLRKISRPRSGKQELLYDLRLAELSGEIIYSIDPKLMAYVDKARSKDASRPTFRYFCVRGGVLYATDGYRAHYAPLKEGVPDGVYLGFSGKLWRSDDTRGMRYPEVEKVFVEKQFLTPYTPVDLGYPCDIPTVYLVETGGEIVPIGEEDAKLLVIGETEKIESGELRPSQRTPLYAVEPAYLNDAYVSGATLGLGYFDGVPLHIWHPDGSGAAVMPLNIDRKIISTKARSRPEVTLGPRFGWLAMTQEEREIAKREMESIPDLFKAEKNEGDVAVWDQAAALADRLTRYSEDWTFQIEASPVKNSYSVKAGDPVLLSITRSTGFDGSYGSIRFVLNENIYLLTKSAVEQASAYFTKGQD